MKNAKKRIAFLIHISILFLLFCVGICDAATRYAVGSGVWSNTSTVWSDSDGGAAGSYVPVDGDTFVILAGISVQVDVDQSAWTGLAGANTVRGGATPGMIYWANGTSGTLRFRTGATLIGTTSTNRGRMLANSDGSWATTTALSNATTAAIILDGTAYIDCANLDAVMRCTNPTFSSVRCYGTKYDFNGATAVDPSADTVDLGTTPPSVGTMVMVTALSGGVLPTGLTADMFYYTRDISGNTCKLALQNDDASIVDITADGSGNCTLYTGFASGSTDVNVLDDVTADIWASGDSVVLADVALGEYDQQRTTINGAPAAGVITLAASVDSAQNPGARILRSTRNCRILHSSTSSTQNIVTNGTNCIFGEIRATAGTGTTFYCYGFNGGIENSATTVMGCSSGLYGGIGNSATTVMGCSSGLYSGTGNSATTVMGCSYGLISGTGNSATTVMGCSYGLNGCIGNSATTVMGCNYGFNAGTGNSATTVMGCNYGLISTQNAIVKNISNCTYTMRGSSKAYARYGIIPATPTWYDRNTDRQPAYLFSDHHAGVFDAYKIFQAFGDVTGKVTAGAGTPTPNQRSGGSAYLIEIGNLQTNLNTYNKVICWDKDKVKVWAVASTAKTYRFYVQAEEGFSLAAGELKLIATYMNSGSNTDSATVESDEAITARTNSSDLDNWDQYIEVSVTPSRDAWIYFDIELYKYYSGGQIWIDPKMVIS